MSENEKSYNVVLKRGYDVSLPDKDGDIEIEFNDRHNLGTERIYLSKQDVLTLLARFD